MFNPSLTFLYENLICNQTLFQFPTVFQSNQMPMHLRSRGPIADSDSQTPPPPPQPPPSFPPQGQTVSFNANSPSIYIPRDEFYPENNSDELLQQDSNQHIRIEDRALPLPIVTTIVSQPHNSFLESSYRTMCLPPSHYDSGTEA